jgi:hypothetical protein
MKTPRRVEETYGRVITTIKVTSSKRINFIQTCRHDFNSIGEDLFLLEVIGAFLSLPRWKVLGEGLKVFEVELLIGGFGK